MSREEAIKELKTIREDYWEEYGDTMPSLDMAIKALEQEPCYNHDEWCHNCKEYDHDKHCCLRYNGVIRKAVEEMKQPKIKVGHWIHTGSHNYHCSECDFIQRESMSEYKYCPNCGAKMVEPQESENKE